MDYDQKISKNIILRKTGQKNVVVLVNASQAIEVEGEQGGEDQ